MAWSFRENEWESNQKGQEKWSVGSTGETSESCDWMKLTSPQKRWEL